MDFNSFKNNISIYSKKSIGGLHAQFKLAPKMRLNYSNKLIELNNPKKAAVLSLFYPNEKGETCFLLTLRANYSGTHASQISFPGGKFDSKDKLLKNTALRETFEEVGIAPKTISIFKEMTNVYIPPSNFLVTPFLGYIEYVPNFKNNHEVEEDITVKLENLLADYAISNKKVTTSYAKNIDVPCFLLNNHIVWGATAMMLSEIRELFRNF